MKIRMTLSTFEETTDERGYEQEKNRRTVLDVVVLPEEGSKLRRILEVALEAQMPQFVPAGMEVIKGRL